MAEATEHRAVDPILPDLQEAAVPLGAARRPPGELQSGPRPGHDLEEAQRARGEVLPGRWVTIY